MPTKGALTVLRVLRSWWWIAMLTHVWRIILWWGIKGLWNPRCCSKVVLRHSWTIELRWSKKWLWSHRRRAIDDRAKRNSVYICPWRRFLGSFLGFFFPERLFSLNVFWAVSFLFFFCCLLRLLLTALVVACCLLLLLAAWTPRISLMRSCLNAFHCSEFIFN